MRFVDWMIENDFLVIAFLGLVTIVAAVITAHGGVRDDEQSKPRDNLKDEVSKNAGTADRPVQSNADPHVAACPAPVDRTFEGDAQGVGVHRATAP